MNKRKNLSVYLRYRILKDFRGGKSIELIAAETQLPIVKIKEALHGRKTINYGKL